MTGVELIIGGKFASAIIGRVVNLGRSYLGDNYDLQTGTRKMLTNLEIQLPHIQSVIEAAEKRQITSRGLETWLEQLKDSAYEAEDVLDDFEAKRIRKSIKGKGKVAEIASSSVRMVKTLIFSDNDLKRLEYVVDKLDKMCMCMADFIKTLELVHNDKGKEHLDNLGSETSSNLAPGVAIFGRDREIDLILDMILNVLYGDFYYQALDDPNLQQGEDAGSSSFSGRIFKTFLYWSKSGKSIQTVKKGGAPKQSRYALRRSPTKVPHYSYSTSFHQQYKSTMITTIEEPHSISNKKEAVIPSVGGGGVGKTVVEEPHSICNQQLAVIPIVGVGGVGKTTVAKKIYNNERLKDHFALRAWVYVSENCDAKKIMQKILCSINDRIVNPWVMNLEDVGNKLKETITNHRFLLILDDLRDKTELKWSDLRSVLCYGEVGSVVVVTTQSTSIANTIRTLPEVTLDVLQPESFWELLQYYAFGGYKLGDLKDQPPLLPSKQEELKKIGKQIAEKLHGLPLAGEVIGTLLSTRLEKEFWEDIRGSDWWNIEGARENILPSIGVGYNYLDPELKQCFMFCSIFPKHYVFERERLIQMWIAQGFIQPGKEETGRLDKGDIRLEDIGRKWFGKLIDRSFFQPTLSDGKYLMHDLVRDLAIAVSSNDFCFVKSHDKYLPSLARHLGINCDSLEVELKCENNTRVRTVLLFGNWTNCSAKSISNIFAKHNGLRMLDLSYIVLETNEPINATCQLSHLRFVDLSFTDIKSIPDEFCALCHLQVLDVRGCFFLELPEGMNQLINLRHLYASSDAISLISSIGKLTKLQELEEFRIGKRKGHRISELMDMNEISGHLLLSNLNNVSSKEEVAKSQLDKKKYLKSLELRFSPQYNDHGPSTKVNMEVLEALKPASSLEILKVGGCRWESFPGWVFSPHRDFCNLKVIHVYCFGISSLPAFGELASLEQLSFDDLPLIEKVGSEFYGSSDVVFPFLKELTFSKMSSWREWSDAETGKMIFPNRKKLQLEKCNVLEKLPRDSFTSSVVELKLSHCRFLCNIETVLQGMPLLTHLSIKATVCNSLTIYCTPLSSLEVMHLADIQNLHFVGGLKSLVNLRKLVIIGFHEIRESYEVVQENDEISQEEIEDVVLENDEINEEENEELVKENDEIYQEENVELVQENDDIYQEKNEEQCLQFLTYLHLRHSKFSTRRILPIVGKLSSLRTLLIENSPAKEYTSDEESWFNQLTSLEKLEFRNCSMLRALPSQLHLLTSLKKLHIYYNPMILSLPENGLPQNLAELYIIQCPDLIRRCQPNQGDDWHKISHIPFVHFDEEIGRI